MTLDEIEKLIASASPAPWPAEFGYCNYPDEGSMACGPIITTDEDDECRQAQADQDFICMARLVMPKLIEAARASWHLVRALDGGQAVLAGSALHKLLRATLLDVGNTQAELEQL